MAILGGSCRVRRALLALLAVALLGAHPGTPSKGVVAGLTSDSEGVLVARARVVWYAYQSPQRARLEAESKRRLLGETESDAGGAFRIAFEASDEGISIEISSPGRPSLALNGPFRAGEEAVDLTCVFPSKKAISGRVTDEAGKPARGARVRASVQSADVEGDGVAFQETSSGPDGSFVLADAPDAPLEMSAELSGYVPAHISPVGKTPILVVLKRGGRVEGTVRDEAGHPVVSAIVAAGLSMAETDAEGTYRIAAVDLATTSVVGHKGDLAGRRDGVRISTGASKRVDLVLSKSAAISGFVLDSRTRRPISGAEISVLEERSAWMGGPAAARTKTDLRGRFDLAGLFRRPYVLSASCRNYISARLAGVVASLSAPAPVSVALERAAVISGRVKDEGGSPVAGARVSLVPIPFAGLARSARGIPSTRLTALTLADGAFRLRGVPPEPSISIEARKEGFVPATRHGIVTRSGDPKPVTLVLKKGLQARGSVVDASSQPIAKAEIRIARRARSDAPGGYASGLSPQQDRPNAISDAAGRFTVPGLQKGDYTARVTRDGFAAKTVPLLEVGDQPISQWPPIVLQASAPIAGIVRNAKGESVGGAQVLSVAGEEASQETRTDAEGKFRHDGFPAGVAVSLWISAEGYARAQLSATTPAETLTITLATTATIRGRVEEDETKRPVEDFRITAKTLMHWEGLDFHSSDGAFELPGIAAGKVKVVAAAPGHLDAEISDVEVGEGETREGIVLGLKRGKSMAGRVLDPVKGSGVANATVSWRREHDRDDRGIMYSSAGVVAFVPNSTTTDAEGRFRYDALPAERLAFTASHPDYLDASHTADLANESSIELTLGTGGSISGVVVSRDGHVPVAGAEVSLEEQGESQGSENRDASRSDADGQFRFEHRKAGRFRLTAVAEGGRSSPLEVLLAPDQRVDNVALEVGGGARIRGVVTGRPPERLGGIQIYAVSKDFQARTATSDDGRFVVDDVPAGPLRIAAHPGSLGTSVWRNVDVPEGAAEVPVEIPWQGHSKLAGRITRRGRALTAWIEVAPDPSGSLPSKASAQTGENGGYLVDDLVDGTYKLSVSDGTGEISRRVTVDGDTTFDVDLPGTSLSGAVTQSATGEPLTGVVVRAQKQGQASEGYFAPQATTDSGGHYAIQDLDPGTYQVVASRDGYQQSTKPASIGEEGQQLDFSLSRSTGLVVTAVDGATGLPLKSLEVVAMAGGVLSFQGTVSLDAAGKGEISSLGSGTYTVYFFSQGYAPHMTIAAVPSPPLQFAMTAGGRVEVRSDQNLAGKVYSGAGVLYLESPWRMDGARSASPPVADWGSFEPGSYRLVIDAPTAGTVLQFQVQEARTATLRIPS